MLTQFVKKKKKLNNITSDLHQNCFSGPEKYTSEKFLIRIHKSGF